MLNPKVTSLILGLNPNNIFLLYFEYHQIYQNSRSPFSKLFQLASLSVFTAGDSSDDLKIAGISLVDAEKIKEFISQKIDE